MLIANGVDAPMTDAPITAVFRTTEEAERMMRSFASSKTPGRQCLSLHWRVRRYANKCPWHRRRSPPR